MNTVIKLDAELVRKYFEYNCKDEYILQHHYKAVAEFMQPGAAWNHADFSNCPVASVFMPIHDAFTVPICDMAREVDRAVRAVAARHYQDFEPLAGRRVELI